MKNNLLVIGQLTADQKNIIRTLNDSVQFVNPRKGPFELDIINDKIFIIDGQKREVPFTQTEFKMMKLMMLSDRIIGREEFLKKCFYSEEINSNSVVVHITRIREILGEYRGCIKTVINEGYEIRRGGKS